MKKYMIADLVKDVVSETQKALEKKAEELGISVEELSSISQELGINPEELDQDDIDAMEELGPSGNIASSMGNIEFEYDPKNNNYVVNIDFDRGGSANYSLDPDTVFELDANGGTFYNQSIRGQM